MKILPRFIAFLLGQFQHLWLLMKYPSTHSPHITPVYPLSVSHFPSRLFRSPSLKVQIIYLFNALKIYQSKKAFILIKCVFRNITCRSLYLGTQLNIVILLTLSKSLTKVPLYFLRSTSY